MRKRLFGLARGSVAMAAVLMIARGAMALIPVIGMEEVRFSWAPSTGAPNGYGVWVSRDGSAPVFHQLVSQPAVVVPASAGERIAIKVQAGRVRSDGRLEFGPFSELSETAWVLPSPKLAANGSWTLSCETCGSVQVRSLGDASIVEGEAEGPRAPWRLVGRAQLASGSEMLVGYHGTLGGIGLWDAEGLFPIPGGTTDASSGLLYLGAADFDGNGIEEIAFFNSALAIVRLYGLTPGGLAPVGGVHVPPGGEPVALGDFTGDGAIEIVWRFGSVLELRRLNAIPIARIVSSSSSPQLLTGSVGDAVVAGSGDYDGDGHLDLLLRRNDGTLDVTYLDRGRFSRLARLRALGGDELEFVVGAANVDGVAGEEILLRNEQSGALSVLFPTNETSAKRIWVLTPGKRWRVVAVRT